MIFNSGSQNLEWSAKVGGARNVYNSQTIRTLPGGFILDKADWPTNGAVLPAGMGLYCEELVDESTNNRPARAHFSFRIAENAAASATSIKVKKSLEGSIAPILKGRFIMKAPDTIDGTGTGVTVTEVDSSHDEYDVLTLSATLGALSVDDVVIEASASGDSASIKVLPNTLLSSDINVHPSATSVRVDGVYFIDGVVYRRRIPPIIPAIQRHLYDEGCTLKFSNSK